MLQISAIQTRPIAVEDPDVRPSAEGKQLFNWRQGQEETPRRERKDSGSKHSQHDDRAGPNPTIAKRPKDDEHKGKKRDAKERKGPKPRVKIGSGGKNMSPSKDDKGKRSRERNKQGHADDSAPAKTSKPKPVPTVRLPGNAKPSDNGKGKSGELPPRLKKKEAAKLARQQTEESNKAKSNKRRAEEEKLKREEREKAAREAKERKERERQEKIQKEKDRLGSTPFAALAAVQVCCGCTSGVLICRPG